MPTQTRARHLYGRRAHEGNAQPPHHKTPFRGSPDVRSGTAGIPPLRRGRNVLLEGANSSVRKEQGYRRDERIGIMERRSREWLRTSTRRRERVQRGRPAGRSAASPLAPRPEATGFRCFSAACLVAAGVSAAAAIATLRLL